MSVDKRTLARSLKISLFIWWFPYILLNIILTLITYGSFGPFFGELLKDVWDNFIFGLIPIAIIYFLAYKAIKIGLLNKDSIGLKTSLFVTFMALAFSSMYLFLYGFFRKESVDIFFTLIVEVIPIFLSSWLFIWLYRFIINKIRNRKLAKSETVNTDYVHAESEKTGE